MTRTNFIASLSMSVLLTACGSTTVDRVAEYPPREEHCILDTYDNERQLQRSWEPVCYIETKSGSHFFANKSSSATLAELKEQACKCGADALIVDAQSQRQANVVDYGEGRGSARAIKYRTQGK